jgi:putative transcriptional regulator
LIEISKAKEVMIMLNENIKRLRKSKGISQEELAIKLNVVRQTVSKWENGLSVPDSSMLIALAEELDASVSILLGEAVDEIDTDELKTISEKLEVINLQLAKNSERKRKTIRWILIALCAAIVVIYIAFAFMQSSYLNWDFNEPELAVAGTILHGIEFLFVRLAPIVFIAGVVGIVLTYKQINNFRFNEINRHNKQKHLS